MKNNANKIFTSIKNKFNKLRGKFDLKKNLLTRERIDKWVSKYIAHGYFFLTLLIITVLLCSSVFFITSLAETWFKIISIIVLLVLVAEMINIIYSLKSYLLEKIFFSPSETSDRYCTIIFKNHPKYALIARKEDENIDNIINDIMYSNDFKETLRKQSVITIEVFIKYLLRYLLTFTLSIFALICLYHIAGKHEEIIKGIQILKTNNLKDIFSLLEKVFYANLVSISTVGFGDITPLTWLGRFVADLQILGSVLILIIGGNMVISIIIENSSLAWSSRMKFLKIHFQRGKTQRNELFSGI